MILVPLVDQFTIGIPAKAEVPVSLVGYFYW